MTDELRRGWVRFEGSGKLQHRPWHYTKRSLQGHYVTLCGLTVRNSTVQPELGEGTICQKCFVIGTRPHGTHV